MTLHDWQQHVTSKGIGQNDAVMMLNDAKAEIEQLRAALRDLLGAIFEASDMAHIEDLLSYIEETQDNARRVLG